MTAAPPEIPVALMSQLDDDGILVLPVGDDQQYLKRVHRRGGEFIIDTVEAVRFVPLVKGNWPETRIFLRVFSLIQRMVNTFSSVHDVRCAVLSHWQLTYSWGINERGKP